MKKVTYFVLCALFYVGSATGADWAAHVGQMKSHPDLIRYYVFDEDVRESKVVKNLAPKPDVPEADFSYRTEHPFEVVPGPAEGSRAVRLDAGWFEAARFSGIERALTVELRLRKHGQGTERGNGGSTNGTLFGLGNGWDSGLRLTTDYPNRRLVFSIGRPGDPKSRNLVGRLPVPDDVDLHIVASWDGRTMRLYVDGLLYAMTDYKGDLTEPDWGFRVGFNNAGVGSVKMDLSEVAVYKAALAPETVLEHALLSLELPDTVAREYRETVEAAVSGDFDAANARIKTLLAGELPAPIRFTLRRFEAELAALSGNVVRSQRLLGRLLAEEGLPPEQAAPLMRRLITSDYTAPLPLAPSGVYRRLLDDPAISLDERQALAAIKCYAEALFAEGDAERAWTALNLTWERKLVAEDMQAAGVSSEPTGLCQFDYKMSREELERAVLQASKRKLLNKELARTILELNSERRSGASFPFGGSVRPFYVAPDGKAENPGTEEKPFGTLRQARDALRQWRKGPEFKPGTICVIVRGGVYPVTETFELTAEDSGSVISRVVYRAYPNEKPVFSGGVSVSGFAPVADEAVLARLPEESRGKIFVATIPGDVEFPQVAPRGYGKNGLGAAPMVELFIGDKPQQIARWPNAPRPEVGWSGETMFAASQAAFVKTGKVHRGFFNTEDANRPGVFEYADSRHERWTQAPDAMLFGYWGHLWAITSCRIEKIDTETKQIVLATNNPYGCRENMPYYAFNLLEEIDLPGEWYLDREHRRLYVYPPEGVDMNAAKVRLSVFPKEFLRLEDVSYTAFIGLEFEEGAGTAARVTGGENVQFHGCGFRRFGNWGLGIEGKKPLVDSCDFVALGGGGIDMKGGDVKTLTPGGGHVTNCFVNDFSRVDRAYAPAVHLDGVGNLISRNLFCDSPAHAMRIEGMEHVIEGNEIHSVVYESDDQSGIDLWGNPFIRGIVIRRNYWHHIGSGRDVAGQSGIRLDDMISGVLMCGNVFFRSSGGQFGGVQIHGGKDNVVDGNLFIDCRYAVSFSPWGERRWLENLDNNFGARARSQGFDPDSEAYRTKYPDYAELRENADRNFVTRNAAIGCDDFRRNSRRNVFLGNLMLPWMPELFEETQGFDKPEDERVPADARKIRGRLTVPPDSSLYRVLGIEPIPMDETGLYRNDFRGKLPETTVTPFFVLE